jgi:hypothetical protein
VATDRAARGGIGTLRERPLHAVLKRWSARPGDLVEAPVDGYVIDLVRDDLLIEIQTRGFSSARRKFETLLARGHRLRVVHPIAVDTWLTKVGADGELLSRRRSPRHGAPCDVFSELVGIAPLLGHPGLQLEVVLVEMEELRRHAPDGPWRRAGWTVIERRLLDVVDRVALRDVVDLAGLLPSDLVEPFTTAELAVRLRRPRRLAQQMAYCLRLAGALEPADRRTRNVRYRRVPRPAATAG